MRILRRSTRLLIMLSVIPITLLSSLVQAEETLLLRQPSISDAHVTFIHGGDVWVADLSGEQVKRITATPAIETNPHFSPDGKTIAFSSNRSGTFSVYTAPSVGGEATRLSFHAANAVVRGWTPDGKHVLFASGRDAAPRAYNRLWTIPKEGGPATLLNKQWANNGWFSPDGKKIVIDRISRWDVEWRNYRGGQNTPLVILDLKTNQEQRLPNNKTIDIEPVWLNDDIYFISDRDWIANVWRYIPSTQQLEQITFFKENDVKQLSTNGSILAFEHNGRIHTLNPQTKQTSQIKISINAGFPWADTKWTNVGESATNASLSPTGKRAVFQARGEVFTVPIKDGSVRNLTKSPHAADRKPIWSPNGEKIAWFSDQGEKGYALMLQQQDGLGKVQSISIGESKMVWEPTFSPDGNYIAFVDDDVRIRVLNIEKETLTTIAAGGENLERGNNGITWSPDSKWLAYSKTAENSFRQIWVWSLENKKTQAITNRFANSLSPAFSDDGKQLYLLASTDYGLNSGWANTSTIGAGPEYSPYVVNLSAEQASPFALESDEEPSKTNDDDSESKSEEEAENVVVIDFKNIERRIMPISMPPANYRFILSGPNDSVFIAEQPEGSRTLNLHKYTLSENEAKPFISGIRNAVVSMDKQSMLVRQGPGWKVVDSNGPAADDGTSLNMNLQMRLNPKQEWRQMFVEAWRYQRDYFYDPNMHGRDWQRVYERYMPFVEHIKHRHDLNYVLDMVNGELSVGHSFVFGGDYPEVAESKAGLLGADLIQHKGAWKVARIYTSESWNPNLKGPLDQPGLNIKEGDYIVGVDGQSLSVDDNPFKFLEGTVDKQTVLHVNSKPKFKDARQVTVKPIASENGLRQRTWVEDNRRLVDKLSNGQLAYVWVPNTSTEGFVSFTRYFFAQQDKRGAVIDERFNGGGFLDDYMVDLMSRDLRAAITNEVPNGSPLLLPAGLKGPKVLLVNELSGSGGDFFPWVFRQQNIGPLIGATTWGGLVKSSVHYSLVDGGALTAPDNAVFDPIKNMWIGENVGIEPDIIVYQNAKALNEGRDPQLERAVSTLLDTLKDTPIKNITPPPYPTPAVQP